MILNMSYLFFMWVTIHCNLTMKHISHYIFWTQFVNAVPLRHVMNANMAMYIPPVGEHSLQMFWQFCSHTSLKQWPALTGINVVVLHPDADIWRAKFPCNLSSLIQLRSMVILKKKNKKQSTCTPCSVFWQLRYP